MTDVSPAKSSVKDLAEGFSLQAKLSNRLWLTLFAVLLAVILPTAPTGESLLETRQLPFGLGTVEQRVFDILSFFLLCVLVVSYCSARANAMIAYEPAHQVINRIQLSEPKSLTINQRQYFDMLSHPTLLRVGPIAVITRSRIGSSKIAHLASSSFYAVTKYAAIGITFGMPLYAMYKSFTSIYFNDQISAAVLFTAAVLGLIATLSIVLLLLADLRLTGEVRKNLHT